MKNNKRLISMAMAWLLIGLLALPSAAEARLPAISDSATNSSALVLALGHSHSCVLIDGGVRCWGWGYVLGTGSNTNRTTPAWVSGLSSGVKAIAAGVGHTCALLDSGAVRCWGRNTAGQLGDGTEVDSLVPVDVSGLGGSVKALAAGGDHTCVVLDTGNVQCWGLNANGQLGAGGGLYQTGVPHDVVGVYNAVALTGGIAHTCALLATGGMKCWGYNFDGEVGNGNNEDQYTPVDVNGLSSSVAQIDAGYRHTCALLNSGGVKCWGALADILANTPQDMPGFTSGVTKIAADGNHMCILNTGGGVRCLGDNTYGQLGDGSTTRSATPVQVSGLTAGATDIAAGYFHTCAVMGDSARCWGNDYYGQLGIGNVTEGWAALSYLRDTAYIAMSVGISHVCGITDAGAARCWGENNLGQLGIGEFGVWRHPVSSPQPVVGLSSGVSSISASVDYSCAVVNGGAQCWGYNNYGQLGNGSRDDVATPTQVSGLTSGVTTIAAGLDLHTCAIVNGGAKCWGYNYLGQLGNGETGSMDPQTTPVDVSGLSSGVSAIAVGGGQHSCAVVNGGIKCWGLGYYGELGNGVLESYDSYPTPQDVIELGGTATQVVAGQKFTCAIVDGAAKCWGRNEKGQLGNGTGSNSATPVQVSGLTSGVTAISASRTGACAIKEGIVYCWGDGLSALPEAVSSSPIYSAVSAGNPTCFLGVPYAVCRGSDMSGQLGVGRVFQRSTPVPVLGLRAGGEVYVHYNDAQPGSVLNVVGANFPSLWYGTLYLNGQSLGQVGADQTGLWRAALKTAGAPEGLYRLTAMVSDAQVVATFSLNNSAPLRVLEGNATLAPRLSGAGIPAPLTAVIDPDGGSLVSAPDQTTYTFPTGAFTGPVTISHTLHWPWLLPPTTPLVSVGPAFNLTAVYSDTGLPAQLAPEKTFTVTIDYPVVWLAIPETLGLWWWDESGAAWSQAGITSTVDIVQQRVTAQVSHLSLFAVLGETRRVYLPLVLR